MPVTGGNLLCARSGLGQGEGVTGSDYISGETEAWGEAGAGDSWAGRKRAGLSFSGPTGPLGRMKALARDPTPHSDLGEQPWWQREDIIPCVREGGRGRASARRD